MEYIRYVGANGLEYPLKKDADHPGMGGGCVGYKTYGQANFTQITPVQASATTEATLVVSEAVTQDAPEATDSLESLELPELREKAKALGIKNTQLFQKNTLITKIKEVTQK